MTDKLVQQDIPKGWQQVKLGEVCDIVNGSTPNTQKPIYWNGNLNWYTPNDLKHQKIELVESERKISEEGLKSIGSRVIPANSVILSTRAPIGYLGITKTKASLNQGCKGLIPRHDTYEKFLYYSLFLNKKALNGLGSGSTFLELSTSSLSSFTIPLPPITEQEKIAEILATVDEQIQKTDGIISLTEKLKKGLVSKLFSNQTSVKKYKIREISEVTSSKRVMVADYVDEGIPFYRSTEIIKKSKNIPVIEHLYISFDKFNFFKNRFGAPENGDLLITAVGTIGDVYMVQKNEVFYFKDGNSLWIRKIKDIILPEYYKIILASSFYRDKLNNIAGGSNQKALTIEKLGNVEIPIPSKSEQKILVDILSSIDEKILINQKLKEKQILLKRGLMQDLLSGKVITI